ncbi:hypothetical protein PISMIDRAFT_330813 [Pisolithus microcarpus 441]|uniref:Uncharacterized protein n=1 Tax=Pisolithus microcarpus 441 TaxID=765257 RepID=A0A0C9YMP4_9AGAM|nr:hypothetical protein PISMIDRAFT_330813 [Pisolithus microcarpus 441]
MDGKLIENESTSGSTFNGNSTGKQKRVLEQVTTGAGTCDALYLSSHTRGTTRVEGP